MLKSFSLFAGLLLFVSAASADNIIVNPSFEDRDGQDASLPYGWTEKRKDFLPLEFSGEHYSGTTSGMIPGDGKTYGWRQRIASPKYREFKIGAMVKADEANLSGKGDTATLYCHIIYKDRPYSEATHVYKKLDPGTYGWKRFEVAGAAVKDREIQEIIVSINGRLTSGRICIDEVTMTENVAASPAALLKNKIDDLAKNLDRIGNVDESVAESKKHLSAALELAEKSPTDLSAATAEWVAAAEAVSHKAWAAMFPDAMADKPVEAQMMYHGIARTKEECDQRLDLIEKTGCNAAYLSIGSWMSAIYPSDVVPMEPGWENFDALTYFIDAAHQRGIKVYAYMAVFYGTYKPKTLPGNIYESHPDWFAKGPNPSMPIFPDPANPEVKEFAVKIYTELATKYKLDGIGLDYIRYPTQFSLNYDENNRKQIQERYGIDIGTGEDLWKDPAKWSKIQEYRSEKVGEVVRAVHDAVRAARPDCTIIACLSSRPELARDAVGQNWARSAHLLDYATPMNYDDISAEEALLRQQREIFSGHKTVYIPAIGGMPEVHASWTISKWAERVAMQRKIGADGIIIYRIGEFDPAVAAFFGKGPFASASAFPMPIK